MLRLFSFLIVIVFVLGCKTSTGPSSNSPKDTFSVLPTDSVIVPRTVIQSNINFFILESITPTARPATIHFVTTQQYGMSGYRIDGKLSQEGNSIKIQLDSIEAPEMGAAIITTASVSYDLGVLSNGLYDLTISINGKTIKSHLLVSDTSYLINIQPNDIIMPSRPRLLRVPTTVIWGQAESNTPMPQQEFIDSLIAHGAIQRALPIGYYFYFTVVSADSFSIPSMMGSRYGQYFLFDFLDSTSVSRALVKSFAKRYGDNIYIGLFGGRGEMYYTTVLGLEP